MAEDDTHKHEGHDHHDSHEHEAHGHHHEAHEHHAEHEMHDHHASASKPASNVIMWIGFVVVLLAVAAVSYTLGTHAATSSSSPQTTQIQQSTLNSSLQNGRATTIPPQPAPPTQISVNSVKYFITPAEAASIIGPGGSSAIASTTKAQLNSSFVQNYSISSEYQAQYNNNATNTIVKSNLAEFIIVSTKSNSIYALDLGSSKAAFNSTFLKGIKSTNSTYVTNQTVDGMTYSFFSFVAPLPPANYSATQTTIFGFRNNTFASIQLFSTNTSRMANATQIASIAAAHLN